MTVDRPPSTYAVQLRRNQTHVERLLWRAPRDRQLGGMKFRRQVPIGAYIVDFLCLEAMLIIELDGGQHTSETDEPRQTWLEQQGYRVLRFWNNEVTENLVGVLTVIGEKT